MMLLCPLALSALSIADESSPWVSEDDNYSEQESAENCRTPFGAMRAGVRHTEARGIGYHSGYTTVEAFGIDDHNPSFMPFLDLRGHVFNDGKGAGNIGIGGRTAFSSISHLLGVYLYYDVRQDQHGLTANQVSPGIELLGSRMEYRLNGYIPVGRTKGRRYDYDFDKFSGNSILVKHARRKAFTGGDAEVGAHITQSTKYDLYAGAGPYYFNASGTSSWGGRVRLLGRYKDYVSLEASYSYDHLFKNIVQGSVAFSVPFGAKLKNRDKNCSDSRNLWFSRAAFSPQRFEIPVIKKITRRNKAINPATRLPWKVWFVNNTSSSAGTYASPFPTLLQAQNASGASDMIYVFLGDGTTNGMTQGIILKNGQTLFGSGVAHEIQTTRGKVKIPRFSSNSPTITNLAGNVIGLNSGNEISGLNIQVVSSGTSAMVNAPGFSLAMGATIAQNTITVMSGDSGINLTASGNVNIFNNTIVGSAAATGTGISLTKGGSIQVSIENNTVSGFQNGISVNGNNLTYSSNSSITGNVVSNFSSGNDNSGIISFGDPIGTTTIYGNILNNTLGGSNSSGINILDVLNIIIANNQITSSVGAIGITVGTSTGNVNSEMEILNNSISGVNRGLLISNSGTSTTFSASINGNQVVTTGVSPAAFELFASGVGTSINLGSFAGNIGGPVATDGIVNSAP